MVERAQSSLEQSISASRETLQTMVITLEQERDRYIREGARVIEKDLFKMWTQIRELDLNEPIWQIVALPQNDPKLVMLLDGLKYAKPPEGFRILAVNEENGDSNLYSTPFSELTYTPTEPKHFYEYGLWALKAMDKFLAEQAKHPKRSKAYYEKLREGLKERFGNKGLKRVENMGAIKEEDILRYEEAQAALWVIGTSPQDLDEALAMYHNMIGEKVIAELRDYGYIHRPDPSEPIVLTQKGEDYLASRGA